MRTIIISFSGRIGSGKTTMCNEIMMYLREYHKDSVMCMKMSFADNLRREVGIALGEPHFDNLKEQEVKARRISLYPDAVLPDTFPIDPETATVRQLMQWWGTEYRRAQSPFYWTKLMVENIKHTIREVEKSESARNVKNLIILIDDTRFPNELECLHRLARENAHYVYFEPVYIMPPLHNILGEKKPVDNSHPSEYALDIPNKNKLFHNCLHIEYGQIPAEALFFYRHIITDYGIDD